MAQAVEGSLDSIVPVAKVMCLLDLHEDLLWKTIWDDIPRRGGIKDTEKVSTWVMWCQSYYMRTL